MFDASEDFLIMSTVISKTLVSAEYIRRSSRTLYGVSFGIDDKNEETLESRFQRRGTPHPKTRHRINLPKRMSIDGHYIQHHEEANFS